MKRRLLSLVSASAVFLQATVAYAAFVSPGALYLHLAYNPLHSADMTMKAYVKEKNEGVEVFVDANASTEGKTLESLKQKIGIAVTIAHPTDGRVTLHADVMMHQSMLYFRLADVLAEGEAIRELPSELRDNIPTPWLTMDMKEIMAENANPSGDFDMALEALSKSLTDMGTPVTPDELKQSIKEVIDAVFDMQHTRFRGGNTYMLSLHPQFIERLLATDTVMNAMESSFDGREALSEIRDMQRMVEQALTFKVKLDTNEEDDLRFMRVFASLDHADLPLFASMQTEVKHRVGGVYLDIPPADQTEDFEAYVNRVTGMQMQPTWDDSEWNDDAWEEEWSDDWEDDWSDASWEDDDSADLTSMPADNAASRAAVRRSVRTTATTQSMSDCDSRSTASDSAYLRRQDCLLKPNPRSIRSDAWKGSSSISGTESNPRTLTRSRTVTDEVNNELSSTHGNQFSHLLGGNPDARITLYVYADLEDPFFARYHSTLSKVLSVHQDDIRLIYNPYPLYFHHDSLNAAVAAECVHRERPSLLDDFIVYSISNGVTKDDIARFANLHGLSGEFTSCLNDATLSAEISAAQSAAYLAGVNGSPTTFVVNEAAQTTAGTVKVAGAQLDGMLEEAIMKVKQAR